MSNIATLDNETMVKILKYLNYCELARSSRVSKRFRDLIRAHRHKLALLHVKCFMEESSSRRPPLSNPEGPKIFNKDLSPEEYNEWVTRNQYSKVVPLENQIVDEACVRYDCDSYQLDVIAYYDDPNQHRPEATSVLYTNSLQANNENWPLLQHFARLLSDPFIHIRYLGLIPQSKVFNLMTRGMNFDCNRLQCEELYLALDVNGKKNIGWIKDHVFCEKMDIQMFCEKMEISDDSTSNYDQELNDLFLNGCASEILISYIELSNIVVNLVEKFLDLKNGDEYKFAKALEIHSTDESHVQVLKSNYAQFITSKEVKYEYTDYVFEFVNNDIGKKLKLSAYQYGSYIFLKTDNL